MKHHESGSIAAVMAIYEAANIEHVMSSRCATSRDIFRHFSLMEMGAAAFTSARAPAII